MDDGNANDRALSTQEAANRALQKLDTLIQNTGGAEAKIRAINDSRTINPGEEIDYLFPIFGDTTEPSP